MLPSVLLFVAAARGAQACTRTERWPPDALLMANLLPSRVGPFLVAGGDDGWPHRHERNARYDSPSAETGALCYPPPAVQSGKGHQRPGIWVQRRLSPPNPSEPLRRPQLEDFERNTSVHPGTPAQAPAINPLRRLVPTWRGLTRMILGWSWCCAPQGQQP